MNRNVRVILSDAKSELDHVTIFDCIANSDEEFAAINQAVARFTDSSDLRVGRFITIVAFE